MSENTITLSYQLLLEYYLSGQVSERQWQEHLKEEDFATWIQREANKRRAQFGLRRAT